MPRYTLGLFSNMYPPGPPPGGRGIILTDTTRGIFVKRMVDDLVRNDVEVRLAVKRSGSVLGYAPFLSDSLRLVRDRDLDIMQAEYIPHSSIVPALLGPRGCPLVLKFHGDDARIFPFRNPLFRSITQSMIRRADHFLTASEDIRSILISLGAAPEKTTALHSGVDTSLFRPEPKESVRERLGLPEDADVFLFVGRLIAWKGLDEIIAAARTCPGAIFIFVGPGIIPPHSDNCRFIGSIPPESVRDWYNAADCLLLPTYTDAVPTSVIEALSCEIPAIVTDIGGCPEIIESGKNGLIIPVRDIPALTEAIAWMQEHPEERRKMGKAGRATVVERYDQRIATRRLMEIHLGLITR